MKTKTSIALAILTSALSSQAVVYQNWYYTVVDEPGRLWLDAYKGSGFHNDQMLFPGGSVSSSGAPRRAEDYPGYYNVFFNYDLNGFKVAARYGVDDDIQARPDPSTFGYSGPKPTYVGGGATWFSVYWSKPTPDAFSNAWLFVGATCVMTGLFRQRSP